MASVSEQVFRQTLIDYPVRNGDPANTANALKQIDAYAQWATAEGEMNEEDARKLFAGRLFSAAKDAGKDYRKLYNAMPKELQNKLLLTPDQYDANIDITIGGIQLQLTSQALYLVGLAASVITTALLKSKLPAWARIPQVLIALYGLTGFFAAFSQTVGTIVNNWNDVFQWGPVILGGQAQDIEQAAIAAARAVVGATKTEFIPRTYTRTQTTKTAKPKVYVGTLLAGKIAPGKDLVRKLDDEITDEQDLINDAQINLTNWLMALPGKLTYEIQIKFNPFDENQVRKVGYWVTLALYVNNNLNKRLFIDEILLGPIDPVKYYPDQLVSKTLSVQIPRELSPTEIKTFLAPDGRLTTVDSEGNIVSVFSAPPTGAFSAPPTVAPQIPTSALFPEIPKDIADKIDRGEIREGDFVPGFGVLKPDGSFSNDTRVAGSAVTIPPTTPIGTPVGIEPTPEQLAARLKPQPFTIFVPKRGIATDSGTPGENIYHAEEDGTIHKYYTPNILTNEERERANRDFRSGLGMIYKAAERIQERYGFSPLLLPQVNRADLDQRLIRSGRVDPASGVPLYTDAPIEFFANKRPATLAPEQVG